MSYKKPIRSEFSERNFNVFLKNDYIPITDVNKTIITDDWTRVKEKKISCTHAKQVFHVRSSQWRIS